MSATADLSAALSDLSRARARVAAIKLREAKKGGTDDPRLPVSTPAQNRLLREVVMKQSADALNLCRLLGVPTP